MLLLLLGIGGSTPPPPPPPPLDHACAYCDEDGVTIYINEEATHFYVPEDTDALCPELAGGGWPDTLAARKRVRKALKRLLKAQKDATFGRNWFAEFEAAQRSYAEVDAEVAVAIGARQARQVVEEIEDLGPYRPQVDEIAGALEVAVKARAVRDVVDAARYAESRALALKMWLQEQDDEEAILLAILDDA